MCLVCFGERRSVGAYRGVPQAGPKTAQIVRNVPFVEDDDDGTGWLSLTSLCDPLNDRNATLITTQHDHRICMQQWYAVTILVAQHRHFGPDFRGPLFSSVLHVD